MNPPEIPETLPVDSLDQFVKLLTAWHQKQVNTLKHLAEIPEGTEVQIEEGVEVELTGEALASFKAGILAGLSLLGDLPFKPEYEDAPAA